MRTTYRANLPGLALAVFIGLAGPVVAATPAPVPSPDEDAFLDILPKVDVPEDVQPIPGAVNEEWRSCQAVWPSEYETSQKGPEARAYRDIYGFVQARAVIEGKDCGCQTKAAEWEHVEAIADRLREHFDATALSWTHTRSMSDAADRLIAVAETMCGGAF